MGLCKILVGHSFATNSALVWALPLITHIDLTLTSTGMPIIIAYGLLEFLTEDCCGENPDQCGLPRATGSLKSST